jgi:hypothetical protein
MVASWEVFPQLPPDLRAIGKDLYDKATDATYEVAESILTTLVHLGKAKGDPAALQRGETMIRVDVKSQVTQAKTSLAAALDGFNRSGYWQGSGSNAFFDYTPRLLNAMTTLETNCTNTADAIAAYRAGIMDLWETVIKETSAAVGKTIGALGQKTKKDLVINIINAWVGWAGNLWAAYIHIDEAGYKALDKIGQVLAAPGGLVNIKGESNLHYDGPAGYQLPMPTDVSLSPDWSAHDVKQRWELKGGASVAIEFEPFNRLVQTIRDNGTFWNTASKKQLDAWFAMPADAFSVVGGSFYDTLSQALSRDYVNIQVRDVAFCGGSA